MSYYLIDYTSPKPNFNFDNVIIGKKIKIDQKNSKYYLYYQNESETPCEIYLKLPRLRLIYNLSNHKYDRLSIPIYPNWDLTNQFVSWVQEFEKNIAECFLNSKIKKEFVSIISKKNNLNFIRGYISEKQKITSNTDNKDMLLSDFKTNGEIDIVLKLSYIWASETKIGLSSSIYQIKYYAPPEQLDIDFIDSEPISKITYWKPKKDIFATSDNQINIMSSINKVIKLPDQIIKPKSPAIIPSLGDLQKALKSLKPIDDSN